jgi:DNA-binding CsgD family transcriptional regulator
MARDVVEVPFVGRVDQLRALHTMLREVEQGETAAIFVMGDSGVGKTRLLTEAIAEMRRAGAVVLSGACLDIGDAAPLHPLRHALRRFQPEQGSVASNTVRELLAILDGDTAGPDGDAGALLERLSRGLSVVSEGGPLVLVVDDLQWADRTTRQLLLYLLAGLGGIRLLVLGAARAETLPGTDPLRLMLLELRRLRSVQVLELQPLDRAETDSLATAIVERPLDPDVADLLWLRSGGNPFFVEELALDIRSGKMGLSDTLREIFLARVEALPPSARSVVHAVAVGVEPVEHELLAQVVSLDEEALIEAVRTAVAQRILEVVEDDGYRFHHRLIREALEPRLLPGERVHFNRRYAEALTAGAGDELQYARVAHHWRMAGDRERALPAAMAAAEEAERLYGFAEAFEHWSAAVALATHGPARRAAEVDRMGLLQRAAEAAHRSGEHDSALVLLEEIDVADLDSPPCWLHTRRARYLAAIGRLAEAEAEYERALAGDDCTPQERAIAAANSAELLVQLGRYADAGQRALMALTLARAASDSASAVVLASSAFGFSQAYLNDPVAGLTAVQQALETAERSGSPVDVACAYLHQAELLAGPLNKLEQGIAVARRGADRAEQLGLGRTYGTRLLAVAGNGLFRIGRWAEAEKVIAAGLRHRPSGAEAVELLLARCRVGVGYGDLDAAERDLEAIDTLLAGGGARHVVPLFTLRAGLAMWRGRHGDARRAVQQALAIGMSSSDDVWVLAPLVWHGLRAEAEARASGGDGPDQEAVRRLQVVVEQIAETSATATGPVRDSVECYRELFDAELGRLEGNSDPAAWGRAAEAWERRTHPYPAAYARLRQAEALFAQRTRNAEASAALRTAYRTARQLGARPFTEEIQTLANRARVSLEDRLPDPPVDPADQRGAVAGLSGPAVVTAASAAVESTATPAVESHYADELATLTARELQVLAEVAEGRTNQAIANRLFISDRTVGVHVSHILDKLQVRSRVQASAVFLRSRRR